MTLVQLTSPAIEPVSLDDFKAHARIDSEDEDTLLAAMLLAARAHTETLSGKLFITQTWRMLADEVPSDGRIARCSCGPFALSIASWSMMPPVRR
jgi:uncharacterized phiE125 gp8 family phage protein